jgi:hypothetical protein
MALAEHKLCGYSRPTDSEASLRSAEKQEPVVGPALVSDYGATTWIPAGWRCRTDRAGNRVITK